MMAGLTEAVNAALRGPERKDITVKKHDFNVKPLTRKTEGAVLYAQGQISHRLFGQKDDQVYYTIAVSKGNVLYLSKRINRSKTLKKFFEWNHAIGSAVIGFWAPPVGLVLGAATPMLGDLLEKARRAVVKNWEQSADLIIAAIATAVSAETR
jgi:hypothetical protein